MILLECIFWLTVLLLLYTYAGYPALLSLMARWFPKPVKKEDYIPPVSVVIAAYNEEAVIEEKVKNILAQDYPAEHMQVIVVSDGSTDRTDEIVRHRADMRVTLLRVEGRQGKTAAQNEAVKHCTGEIVVFTDSTTDLELAAIRQMMRNFADPEVSVVGGDLTYVGKDKGNVGAGGESYWNYEKQLKSNEALVNSLIGVSGCFYSVRKNAYSDIAPHLISDFVVALDAVERGHRVVYEPQAQCSEETLRDPDKEYSMRVRVAVRSYAALWGKRNLLNIFRYGFFSIQLFSHKVLRYATLFMLAILLLTNVALTREPFYQWVLAGQLLFYGLALLGYLTHRLGMNIGFLAKPYYFMLVHQAATVAFIQFLRGERKVTWEPIR